MDAGANAAASTLLERRAQIRDFDADIASLWPPLLPCADFRVHLSLGFWSRNNDFPFS